MLALKEDCQAFELRNEFQGGITIDMGCWNIVSRRYVQLLVTWMKQAEHSEKSVTVVEAPQTSQLNPEGVEDIDFVVADSVDQLQALLEAAKVGI